MDGAHIHLILNHLPVMGTGLGVLILLAGMILKNVTVKQTGLFTLVLAALSISLALFTGDPAGETIRGMKGVDEQMIEFHEKLAYSSLWAIVPSGLIAALAFYCGWKNKKGRNTLAVAALVLSLVSVIILGWVGYSGGQIMHPEIRQELH